MTTTNIILLVIGVSAGAILLALVADSIYKHEKKKIAILDYIAETLTRQGEKSDGNK